jgi:predicted dinucleotide-binding enzyme
VDRSRRVEAAGDLTDKIVVDCTNPVAPGLQLALGTTTSGGERVAEWAKGAQVVKAFNTTGWMNKMMNFMMTRVMSRKSTSNMFGSMMKKAMDPAIVWAKRKYSLISWFG